MEAFSTTDKSFSKSHTDIFEELKDGSRSYESWIKHYRDNEHAETKCSVRKV